MKKYISFLSFIALFFIGIQSSSAQTVGKQQSPEAIAKQETYQIHQLVNLTGEQQSAIFKVLVDAQQNSQELNKMDDSNKLKQEGTKTVNTNVEASFKKILTPEQYKTYQASLEKEKQ
jgi:Spy/CpxP family protein refolding chaperone